jgi:hypothetical protein
LYVGSSAQVDPAELADGTGLEKLGFEKPGSHTQALTFAPPAASVSECPTQRVQETFASTSL